MRYINLRFTYLLTYLLTWGNVRLAVEQKAGTFIITQPTTYRFSGHIYGGTKKSTGSREMWHSTMCLQLCQKLTNIQGSFTVIAGGKFTISTSSKKPTNPKGVATLPCEILCILFDSQWAMAQCSAPPDTFCAELQTYCKGLYTAQCDVRRLVLWSLGTANCHPCVHWRIQGANLATPLPPNPTVPLQDGITPRQLYFIC